MKAIRKAVRAIAVGSVARVFMPLDLVAIVAATWIDPWWARVAFWVLWLLLADLGRQLVRKAWGSR